MEPPASKLEPFLLMSKSAKGAAAAKLIQDATSAPGVFVFGELLELPSIQQLADSHAQHLALLKLFAYGTYMDYKQNKDAYPLLNEAQLTKLKQLTLVSLASSRRVLPYDVLLPALDAPSVRALEDLIIDAIYQNVLRGRLDQAAGQLQVEYTLGRDLEPELGVQQILASLQEWARTTSAVISTLDAKLGALAAAGNTQRAADAEYEHTLQSILKEVTETKKTALSRRGTMEADAMDVDDENSQNAPSKAKGRKWHLPGRKATR